MAGRDLSAEIFGPADGGGQGRDLSDEIFGAVQPVKEAGFSLGDIAKSFGIGAAGSTKALTDVAGAENFLSSKLGKGVEGLQQSLTPERQAEMERQAARMKAAEESGSLLQEIKAGALNVAEAPLQSAAQAIGSFVPYLPALFAAPVAAAMRLSVGSQAAIRAVAQQAPKVIGTAQGAGAIKGSIYDGVLQAEMEAGVDPEIARQKADTAQSYFGGNFDQIALGAGLGLAAGSTGVEKFFTPVGRAGLAPGIAQRVAGATLAESLPEAAQGGQERLAQNIALQREGYDVDTFKGVAGAATQEALTGALGAAPIAALVKPSVTPSDALDQVQTERDQFAKEFGEGTPVDVPAPVAAVELPGGFTVTQRELSREEVPESFGIFAEGSDKPLTTVATQADIDAKITSLTEIRAEEQARLLKESDAITKNILTEQRKIDVMEATGQTDTDEYVQAKALLAQKELTAAEQIKELNDKIASYSAPLSFAPIGQKTNIQSDFVATRGEEVIGSYPTFEEAEATLRAAEPEVFKQADLEAQTLSVQADSARLDELLRPLIAKFNLGDVGLNIVDKIANNAGGSYFDKLIEISIDEKKPILTMRHEAMHALRDLEFFTPQQWNALTERANKQWIKEYLEDVTAEVEVDGKMQIMSRRDAYKKLGYSQEAIIEEAVADAFGAYERGVKPPPGLIAALFKKLQNFFKNFGQALRGAGFESSEDIFERVERGELKSRKPKAEPKAKPAEAEEKLSLTPKGIPQKIFDLHEKLLQAEDEATGRAARTKGIAPGAAKRNQTMAFRRLNSAVMEFVGKDEQKALDLMVKMNEESSKRDGEKYSLAGAGVPRSTRNIMESASKFAQAELGLNTEKIKGKSGVNNVRDVGKQLNRYTLDQFGGIKKDSPTAKDVADLAEAVADEVGYQLRVTAKTGTGTGWYSNNYPNALKKLGKVFPELSDNPLARSVFSSIVAVTSNGEDVSSNIKSAIRYYQDFRNGKKMVSTGSRRATALENNLNQIEKLFKEHGENFARELTKEITVADLNAYLRSKGEEPSSDYLKETKVPAAAIYFGPKLGAFFANLSGSEGYLTMDLWWTRSINRMRGMLIPKATESSINAFRDLMDRPSATREEVIAAAVPFKQKYEEHDYKTELEFLTKAKEPRTNAGRPKWLLKARRKAGPAFNQLMLEHKLEKMANTIYKNEFEMLEEAPFNASDRKFMYDVARSAQKILKSEGVDLSLADIQAALWYYEKRLYAKLTGREADDIGYEEAIIARASDNDRREGPSVVFSKQPDRRDDAGRKGRVPDESGGQLDGTKESLKDGTNETTRPDQSVARSSSRGNEKINYGPKYSLREDVRSYRGRDEVQPGTHTRRSLGDGTSVRVLGAKPIAEFTPIDLFKGIVSEHGFQSPVFYEISGKDAAVYEQAIQDAKKSNPYGAAVYVYPVDEYADMRLFLTEDGKSGIALKRDDIVSVFSGPPHKGSVNSSIQLAVQEGGRRLDAFATVLPEIYHANGFKVVGRMKWNEDYKPDNWNKKTFAKFNGGEPDVVYMSYDPEDNRTIFENPGKYFDDPDELAQAQRDAVNTYFNEGSGYGTAKQAEASQKPKAGIVLGKKQPDAISVNGAHYGLARVSELDASKYGTGLRGAERRRLEQTDDERIKRRAYFYIAKPDGSTPTPESGVGQYVYTQKFDNILVSGPTMSRLFREANGDSNNFESLIVDAGYDGYAVPSMGMMVILNNNVPVNYVGPRSEVGVAKFSLKNVAFPSVKAAKEAVSATEVPKTDAFKRFIAGNQWSDSDGNPKVFYHATAREFFEFTPAGQSRAIFLAETPEEAETFGSIAEDRLRREIYRALTKDEKLDFFQRVIDAQEKKGSITANQGTEFMRQAKRKIPVYGDFGDIEQETYDALLDLSPTRMSIMPLYARAETPFEFQNPEHVEQVMQWVANNTEYPQDFPDKWLSGLKGRISQGLWQAIEDKRVQQAIRTLGFDAFTVREGRNSPKNYAVYQPEQVKSVTGNIDGYGREIKDIRFSLPTLPTNLYDRVNETTTTRERKGFAQRMIEAISPQSAASFRAKFLNRYNQLSVYDKKLAEQMGGAALLADQSAESAALFSDVGAGIAASAMGIGDRNGGIPVLRNGITTIDTSVKGLVASLAPLASYNDPVVYQLYQYWAMVKRGTRLDKEGKPTGITTADVAYAKTLEAKFPEFVSVQKDLIAFNNGLVKYMVDTGVLSQKNGAEYMKYADYVPFYRQMDGEKTVGPNLFQSLSGVKPPKKLKGAIAEEAPLADFLETMVRNTQSAIQAGIKNYAGQRAVNVASQIKAPGMGVTRLKTASTAPDVINVLEKGELVSYGTADTLLIEAVKSLNLSELPFMGILSAPADLLRNLVTKDPGFIMANLLRDSLSAYVTSGVKMTPVVDTVMAFGKSLTRNSPTFELLLNAGIISGYDSGNIEKSGLNLEKDLAKKAGQKNALLLRPFTSLWDALEKGTTASDAATRVVIYERVLAETGNEAEALFRSMEVMNFHRKGSSALIRVLTAAIPFFNARLQGLDLFYRASTGNMNNKDAAAIQRQFFVRGMTMMALSGMYYFMVSDDEEYKKQEQETKDNNWLIPYLGIRIPIPFEVGVLFKTIPERIAAYTFGNDTGQDLRDALFRNAVSTFAFNPIPQTVKPLVEAAFNVNTFTFRPIVSEGMQDVDPQYQVGPGTSSVAKGIAGVLGLSPIKVDHIIKGYTGTMGMYAIDTIDMVMDQFSDSPKATKRFAQLPIIKRFAVDPEARGKVTEFYKLKDSVDSVVRTMNFLEKQGESEEYVDYLKKNQGTLAFKDYIRDTEKAMKELRQMKSAVQISKMSGDEKRDAIIGINRAENDINAEIQRIKIIIASSQ